MNIKGVLTVGITASVIALTGFVGVAQAVDLLPVPTRRVTISYSIPQAILITNSLTARGEISNDGVSNAIVKKLEEAQDKLDTNKNVSRNLLEATVRHIEAQEGVHITTNAATFLKNYINTLIRLL